MEFVNGLYHYLQSDEGGRAETLADAIDTLLLVMAPMTPHITAELWERRRGGSIHAERWPDADPTKLTVDTVTLVVQVNGKLRDRLEVAADIGADEAEQVALASDKVRQHLGDGPPRKVIVKVPKLVNIVV
jgi:leucyl-tRNA synthetase